MISKEDYLKRFKKSKLYQQTLNTTERKRMLKDAEKLWERRYNKYNDSEDAEKELNEAAFIQGYIDGINELDKIFPIES